MWAAVATSSGTRSSWSCSTRVRATCVEMFMAATARPDESRSGAPPARPISSSWSTIAQPWARTCFSRTASSATEVTVFAVCRSSRSGSTSPRPSGASSARSTRPIDVQ